MKYSPIWFILWFIRFATLCIGLTLLLWKNATLFDQTEIRTILEVTVLAIAYEILVAFINIKFHVMTPND